ncbi:hypothetical protein NTE_00906 [Candidatus Nitrososphaera evergladensis SR1]|uniref:Uncharacterized protein n=1 Tax=Candidatus Nitrososphaera evergladensis SR1 TaxID=1459636 RepID=A0A075MQ36_9ARCH|nr:hypothetical protein NTE_00906 [Candidatus Nitrososphaera evergladensis SR1]
MVPNYYSSPLLLPSVAEGRGEASAQKNMPQVKAKKKGNTLAVSSMYERQLKTPCTNVL